MTFWLTVLFVVLAVLMLVFLFMKTYPAFGGTPSPEQKRRIRNSGNFSGGKFNNPVPTSMKMSPKTMAGLLVEQIKGNPGRRPENELASEPLDGLDAPEADPLQVTWFGHSAFMLRIHGSTLLFDPMLGNAPSPVPAFGGKRYGRPIEIDRIPAVDAVVISHDHYDHLDYGSIKKIKDRVGRFFVPLGVGAHLERWGVEPNKIKEHDWWEETEFQGLVLTSAPARHFSGRGLTNRNSTLWCSWIVRAPEARVFFSGDSGYGPHFAEIGDKYGPFDLTLMECGQYDERWAAIHMLPEETVQAHLDVKGKRMIPVHWGAFTLAMHHWTDPAERAVKAAKARGVAILTPKIGQTLAIGESDIPTAAWWRTAGAMGRTGG